MAHDRSAGGIQAGTIRVVADERQFQKLPTAGYEVLFGRGTEDVHVAVGIDDPYVSRKQGALAWDGRDWWLRNVGKLPIRLVDESMVLAGQELRIKTGCTPLLVGAPQHRVHLVEVHVAGVSLSGARIGPDTPTRMPDEYELSDTERLVLVAVGQRYLRQDPNPQPLSWSRSAEDLSAIPGSSRSWTDRSVEHIVAAVRRRLANAIPNIMRGPERELTGSSLNHNLITALVRSATLTPFDLQLLGEESE